MWIKVEQYKAVGATLAASRKHSGFTQQDLAKRLGKPQSFVSEYERGQRRIDIVEFIRIARTLDADPVSILLEIVKTV